jgi:site-specific DNA recombinase
MFGLTSGGSGSDALTDAQTNQEVSTALRSLIGDIVLTPGEKRGEVHATLRGELMSILESSFAAPTSSSARKE